MDVTTAPGLSELIRIIWGAQPLSAGIPDVLRGIVIIALCAIYIGILLPILHKWGMYPPDNNNTHGALVAGDIVTLVVAAAMCVAGYMCSRKFLLKA